MIDNQTTDSEILTLTSKTFSNGVTTEVEGDVISSKITSENIPYIFALVSKNLYSDPISSIVREIVSNAYDANLDSGSLEPIIVSINEDTQGDYFSVRDFGNGMSPKVIKEVYMSWFTSTKRFDPKAIGYFGIGSKSPFSYTDQFYITTYSESKKYEYIFFQTEKEPQITLLTETDTEEQGTEIKIYFTNNNGNRYSSDGSKFISAINEQLSYFEQVVYQICNKYGGIDNNFKIHEGKHFKFSTLKTTNYLHISLGRCSYSLAIPELFLELPIALKFEIGELNVTPNREQIVLTEESIEKIKRKYYKALKEIIDIWKEQHITTISNLSYYLDKNKAIKKISLKESLIVLPSKFCETNNLKYKFEGYDEHIPKNPLFIFSCKQQLVTGRKYKYSKEGRLESKLIFIEGSCEDKKKNRDINNGLFIALENWKKFPMFEYICRELKIEKDTLGKVYKVKAYVDFMVKYVKNNYIDYKTYELQNEEEKSLPKETLEKRTKIEYVSNTSRTEHNERLENHINRAIREQQANPFYKFYYADKASVLFTKYSYIFKHLQGKNKLLGIGKTHLKHFNTLIPMEQILKERPFYKLVNCCYIQVKFPNLYKLQSFAEDCADSTIIQYIKDLVEYKRQYSSDVKELNIECLTDLVHYGETHNLVEDFIKYKTDKILQYVERIQPLIEAINTNNLESETTKKGFAEILKGFGKRVHWKYYRQGLGISTYTPEKQLELTFHPDFPLMTA